MGFFFPDDLFDAQAMRTLGHAPYGGADLGECIATTGRITKTDAGQWFAQWSATARRIERLGDASAAAGRHESARAAYLRASNYFRTAGIFLMGDPTDTHLVESHRLQVETFRKAVDLLAIPADVLEIPFESHLLPAYFFRPSNDDSPKPTVILTGGYDGTVEELYFANGVAALERGYNVLAFDGPGQGSLIIDEGIPFRPDWETVVSPVFDYAISRPDVDPARVAIIGWSFGGYLAPRAASGEPRIAACVSDCGPYDLFEATMSRIPDALSDYLQEGNRAAKRVLDGLWRYMEKKPSGGWALRRNLWVHGVGDPLAFIELSRAYTLKGIEEKIRCPTFVAAAEGDDLSSRAKQLFDALTCRKAYAWFTAADGAGSHCESGARTLFNQRAFDWLDSVLA